MLPYIWGFMIIASVVYSLINGTQEQLNSAILSSADEAIELTISMCGTVCLWSGIMAIADKRGITDAISKLLSPLTGKLFPNIDKNGKSFRAINMNITANLLGLGNAATPLGIKAMQELKKERPCDISHDRADRNMIMFVILNTTSVQLIPTMIMSILQSAGNNNPSQIIPFTWAASISGLICGVISVSIFAKREAKKCMRQ